MKPKFAKALALLAATGAVAPLSTALALPVINGDFSDSVDLAGWMASGNVVGEPTGDFAQLETDGIDPVRTLEQTVTIPAAPSTVTFDFAFSTDGTSVPGGIFPDSFAVSLITTVGDFLDILVVDLLGVLPDPSDGIEWITGALPIDVDLDPAVTIPGFSPVAGGTSYSGRINLALPASVRGQAATLYFDLYDEPDGASTIAAVDNVSVDPANTIPVPATLGLLLIGMAGSFVGRNAAGGSADRDG
jgi:hypothetical protein